MLILTVQISAHPDSHALIHITLLCDEGHHIHAIKRAVDYLKSDFTPIVFFDYLWAPYATF